MKAKVDESGRVTIPRALRERLGIVTGTLLDFFEDQGRLIAEKTVPVDAVERVYGRLGHGRSTKNIIESLRGH
jgi:antitoxin PrlF